MSSVPAFIFKESGLRFRKSCLKEAAWFGGWEKGEMWIYKELFPIPAGSGTELEFTLSRSSCGGASVCFKNAEISNRLVDEGGPPRLLTFW